ncbi:TlpA disulfide reductase family protein [Rugamonas sp.]|uniref:TlpA family protein disulfide reductase n=1 Tax=Rugamonas sp. TaxID=1926287 RepID=UPI0025F64CFA|nr:TlpA disulfide reductase family protein [Rugamonas sp.]
MYNITVGPLTLPTSYVLMLAALLLAIAVAHLSARPRKLPVGAVLTDAALAGLLVGRAAFVLLWWKQYSAAPWSMIDIRDGGIAPWPALAAGLALVAWRCRRQAPLRRPLALGVAAGLLMWQFAGGAALSSSTASARRPDLALTALSGESTTLAAAAHGKPAVVNLWASWCPPCRQEMPMLVDAQAGQADLAFIFVNQGESLAAALPFIAQQAAMSNVLLDPRAAVGRAVGSSAMPTTLFYDAGGKLVDMHIGVLSAATLASKLEKLRAAGH